MDAIRSLYRELLVDTFTKEAALRRIRILREYLETICFTGETGLTLTEFGNRHGVANVDAVSVSRVLNRMMEHYPDAGSLRPIVYDYTNTLVKLVEEAKTTVLYLPLEPDDEMTGIVGSWIRTEMDPDLLMEFREDSSIGMGAGIAIGGKYQEYGVRYFLDQHRDALFQIFETATGA